MEKTLFVIILLILIFDYSFDRILDALNASRWSTRLPRELQDIYDEGKYRTSQNYFKENMRLGIITSTLSFLLVLGMLILGGFGWLDQLVRQYTEHPVAMALLFFGLLGLAADVLSTPFDIYGTFVIEERYGFNRTTPKTYVLDKLKGWLLAIIFGGIILSVFVWFYSFAGPLFWVYIWIFITAFSLFMTLFYSTLIVPLFNKQTPLEQGPLREAIEQYAHRQGFQLKDIYVIDGSRRSTKANAYFSGLGSRKRIVLFDTLVKDHSIEELVAVLAHEVGHYKKKHTLKGILFSIAQTGVMLYLLSLFINRPELSYALGAQQHSFHMGLLAFGLLYAPVSLLLGMFTNYLSRKHEYQADAYAARTYQPEPLQQALKKLSVNNLSNLRPHPVYVFVHYSHPPLLKRLKFLDQFK